MATVVSAANNASIDRDSRATGTNPIHAPSISSSNAGFIPDGMHTSRNSLKRCTMALRHGLWITQRHIIRNVPSGRGQPLAVPRDSSLSSLVARWYMRPKTAASTCVDALRPSTSIISPVRISAGSYPCSITARNNARAYVDDINAGSTDRSGVKVI